MIWQCYWKSWSWPTFQRTYDTDYDLYSCWFFIGPLQFHWYSGVVK